MTVAGMDLKVLRSRNKRGRLEIWEAVSSDGRYGFIREEDAKTTWTVYDLNDSLAINENPIAMNIGSLKRAVERVSL